jgi:hypothetical protein
VHGRSSVPLDLCTGSGVMMSLSGSTKRAHTSGSGCLSGGCLLSSMRMFAGVKENTWQTHWYASTCSLLGPVASYSFSGKYLLRV